MASKTVDRYREGAEVHHGDALCKRKSVEFLEELGLPNGLLPLDDIEEFGYNRGAGFVWLRQKKRRDHTFQQIKQAVSYAPEVTAFVEANRMKKMTGVKTKGLLLWLSVIEMYIGDPSSGNINFKTGAGVSATFPASAFELEREEEHELKG